MLRRGFIICDVPSKELGQDPHCLDSAHILVSKDHSIFGSVIRDQRQNRYEIASLSGLGRHSTGTSSHREGRPSRALRSFHGLRPQAPRSHVTLH